MRALLAAALALGTLATASPALAGSKVIDTPTGGKVSAAAYRAAVRGCADYAELDRVESELYGPYGDWAERNASMWSCMLHHGVRIGYRQRDGRVTVAPFKNSRTVAEQTATQARLDRDFAPPGCKVRGKGPCQY